MKFDRTLFIAKFAEEAKEHLKKLTDGILALEADPENGDSTKIILRSAHTLKGSSRMLKFDDIGSIAHRMEDLLIDVRDRKIQYRPEIFDLLLACVDRMEQCLTAIVAGETTPQDVSALVEDLGRAQRGEPILTLKPRTGQHGVPSLKEIEKPAETPPVPHETPTAKPTAETPRATPPPDRSAVDPMSALEQIASRVKEPGAPKKPERESATRPIRMEETVRIGMDKLDRSIRLAGELIVSRMQAGERLSELSVIRESARRCHLLAKRASGSGTEIEGTLIQEICDEANVLSARADDLFKKTRSAEILIAQTVMELQDALLTMRMLPLSSVLHPFPRHVRELARDLGKDVELHLEGEETELDKKILERLGDALLHLLRNAVDHGIETPKQRTKAGKNPRGLVIVRASHESGNIKIVIEDDGAGLDLDAIRKRALQKGLVKKEDLDRMSDHDLRGLIFEPGFSTADIITDVSGRGVGLDVVKQKVEELKGSVAIDSELGGGTKISITLPLTLASLRVLFVSSTDLRFAIPLDAVQETLKVKKKDVIEIVDRQAIRVRNQLVPLLHLGNVLDLPDRRLGRRQEREAMFVVIAHSAGARIGIVVDSVSDAADVILKPLPRHLQRTPHVSGLTISGSNEILLVLHVPDLVASARTIQSMVKVREEGTAGIPDAAPSLLVVDDSLNTREIERSILEAEGYQVDLAKDGLEALRKVRERSYDLIVTDIEMPRLDGFSLTAQLREDKQYRDVPVVIVTSREKEEDKRRGIEVGANAYIVKGAFDQTNLIDTVKSLIG